MELIPALLELAGDERCPKQLSAFFILCQFSRERAPRRDTLTLMKIAIDLSASEADRLHERAKSLGVSPEDLARAAVTDLLTTPDDAFSAAAELVLTRNAELYKRLA